MHELPVVENILEIALQRAKEAGAKHITDLHLVVGPLSSVVDEPVQFYWDMVSKGTPAEGARLHFRRVPIELECLACSLRYTGGEDDLACPACDSGRIKVLAGEEFYLEAIDVDEGDPVPAAQA